MKKTLAAVLLAASLASAAVAADRKSTSVARPDVVAPGNIYVHPFVDVKGIRPRDYKEIFLSDAVNNVVNIYNSSGKQLAQLTGFSEPQGLATDSKGNLYVADTNNSRILVYAPPYTKKPKKLADPGYYPAGVSVVTIGTDTFVAASNICSAPDCTRGGFRIFKNGKAQKALRSSTIYRVYFLAFDAAGNVYADGQDSDGNVVVGELANATSSGKTFKALTTNNMIGFPGGVQVTTTGKIAVNDQDFASVYTYNAPKNGSLGSPKTTVLTGSGDAVTFAFTATNKDLWTADAFNEATLEFKYPAGGSALHSISVPGARELIGVALVPAEVPGK